MNKTTLEYYYTTSGHMYTTARESLIISPGDLTLGRFPTLSKKIFSRIPGFGYDSSTIFTVQK